MSQENLTPCNIQQLDGCLCVWQCPFLDTCRIASLCGEESGYAATPGLFVEFTFMSHVPHGLGGPGCRMGTSVKYFLSDAQATAVACKSTNMGNPNIEQRKFTFCPNLADLEHSCLIVECHKCARFLAACCPDSSLGGNLYRPRQRTCHHLQLVFTDGACSNNGREGAIAGLGISIGNNEEYCWSIPVDDAVDPDAPRTSQRAELLAAIEGLKKLEEAYQFEEHHSPSARHRNQEHRATYIIVTDSEYVVKGITEWFPAWRRRGWRTSGGKRPTNIDLFLKLDECVTSLEQDRVAVGFWHVERKYNRKADNLAKLATNF